MTPEFWETWQHYHDCSAVNWQVPDVADWLVRRNAAIITGVLKQAERSREQKLEQLVLTALATRKAGR